MVMGYNVQTHLPDSSSPALNPEVTLEEHLSKTSLLQTGNSGKQTRCVFTTYTGSKGLINAKNSEYQRKYVCVLMNIL